MAGDKHSKTEKPTAKRRKDARKKGQLPRTADLVPWASVLAMTYVLPWLLGRMTRSALGVLEAVRVIGRQPDPGVMVSVLSGAFRGALATLAPVFGLAVGVAVVGNVAQTGLVLTTHQLKPQMSRLNPLQGLKRLVNVRSVWGMAKSFVKMVIIALVAWPTVRDTAGDLTGGSVVSAWTVLPLVGARTLKVVRSVAFAALVLAVVDYAYQRRSMGRELMMTKHEVKEEYKQGEGNPEVKGKIRSKALQMTRNRMIANIRKSDVVVVNPVHFAVALQYEPGRGAPRVVAKGAGPLAERIRDEATAHGVPIVESVPLARALYAAVGLDEEIPFEMYEAVARLLAFVHRLRTRSRLSIGPSDGMYRLPEPATL